MLVVGLYRAPYAWEQSRTLVKKGNTHLSWDTILVTNRFPYCNHPRTRFVIVNATTWIQRLHIAYTYVDWERYGICVVIRPDVLLTKPIDVERLCLAEKTTYIISGNFVRRYNRDWDFGLVACDKDLLRSISTNNLTKSSTSLSEIPSLPSDFHGCWGKECERNWRYPYMENVIQRHSERGVSLRNLDSRSTFLSLKRGNSCYLRKRMHHTL